VVQLIQQNVAEFTAFQHCYAHTPSVQLSPVNCADYRYLLYFCRPITSHQYTSSDLFRDVPIPNPAVSSHFTHTRNKTLLPGLN